MVDLCCTAAMVHPGGGRYQPSLSLSLSLSISRLLSLFLSTSLSLSLSQPQTFTFTLFTLYPQTPQQINFEPPK